VRAPVSDRRQRDPAGVIHTHRTIGFEVRQLGGAQPTKSPPAIVGAPVGHGIGMLAALLEPLAAASVSVFVASTYHADLVFVPEEAIERAVAALRDAGHTVDCP